MSQLGFHLCIHLLDGSVIAKDARERRTVARVVLAQGAIAGLYVFSLPDTHLHMGARCEDLEPGELCRRVGISLKRQLGLDKGFVLYPPIAVRDQRHQEQLLRYILTQHQHHRVLADPFRESSNLPDLLGLRAIGASYTAQNLGRLLPRLSRETLLGWLGAPWLRPDTTSMRSEDLAGALAQAACRAACLPDLRGSHPLTVAVRRAATQVALDRLSVAQLAPHLGVAPRTLMWLRHRPADPELVHAIRMQLALGTHLEESRREIVSF